MNEQLAILFFETLIQAQEKETLEVKNEQINVQMQSVRFDIR